MGAHEQKKQKTNKKRPHGLLIAFLILLGIMVILCAVVLGIWLHGRSSFTGEVVAPAIPTETPAEEEAQVQEQQETLLDEYTLRYGGRIYRYKESMCNILVIGVDGDQKPAQGGTYGDGNQCDVVLLVAMDTASGEITLLSVSRDTLCEMEVLDENGESQGVAQAQLALSYAYGDGLEKSCELCRDAVSNLFYGLQIHGYGAFYMGGIAELNDAVGGVTVTVLDDYPFTGIAGCWNMTPGASVTLTGQQAALYVRCRLEDETGNALRMQRQKQYLLAFLSQAKAKVLENPTYVLSLYNAVKNYVVTDLSVDRISYLATQAANMHFPQEILSLEGELVLGAEQHMEFTPDKEALTQLILDVFYEDVTERVGG